MITVPTVLARPAARRMQPVKLRKRRVKVPSRSLILPGTGAEIARDETRSGTTRHTGALRAAGRFRRVPGRGDAGRRAARAPGRDRGPDRLHGGGRGDLVRRRAGRGGGAGRHRLAHRRGVLPAALRAAAPDRAGRLARRRRGWRDRGELRRTWPGVPLVPATAHTGKYGYVFGPARPAPGRTGAGAGRG